MKLKLLKMKFKNIINWQVGLFFFVNILACNHSGSSSEKIRASKIKKDKEEVLLLINTYIKGEIKSNSVAIFDQPYNLQESKFCIDKILSENKKINLKVKDLIVYSKEDSLIWINSVIPIATNTISKRNIIEFRKSREDAWDKFRATGYKGFYTFSIPIFSKDYKFAIFYVGFVCGPLCGNGDLLVFEKKNSVWVLIEKTCGVVS